MPLLIQQIGESMSLLIETKEDGDPKLLSHVKGAVAATIDDEGDIMVLIKHKGTFEWMDITDSIPKGSPRQYGEGAKVVDFPSTYTAPNA